MRKDMGKIITERPRSGSGNRNLKTRMNIKWRGEEGDYDVPSKASNSAGRQYGYNKREFTDLLGPIKRWLYKQVGRSWNTINSEMCEVLDKRKVTHKHVFTHVEGWVATDVYLGKDGLYHERPYGWVISELYVDPNTGILKRQTKPEDNAPKRPLSLIVVNDYEEYRKIEDIWYHTKYMPGGTFEHERFCDVRKKYLKRTLTNKRQLGKKELKKLGLR